MGSCHCRKTRRPAEKKEFEYIWTVNDESEPLIVISKGETLSPTSLAPLAYTSRFQRTLFSYAFDDSLISLKQLFISCNAPYASPKWFDDHIRERLALIFEIEEIPEKYTLLIFESMKTQFRSVFFGAVKYSIYKRTKRGPVYGIAHKNIFLFEISSDSLPKTLPSKNYFQRKATQKHLISSSKDPFQVARDSPTLPFVRHHGFPKTFYGVNFSRSPKLLRSIN